VQEYDDVGVVVLYNIYGGHESYWESSFCCHQGIQVVETLHEVLKERGR